MCVLKKKETDAHFVFEYTSRKTEFWLIFNLILHRTDGITMDASPTRVNEAKI